MREIAFNIDTFAAKFVRHNRKFKRMAKQSEIAIQVHLDENNVPEKLEWRATDAPFKGFKEAKALMVGFWDPVDESALRIDLWTKEMRVDEMDRFYFQSFLTMADSYERSTNNPKGAADLRTFAHEFAKKAGIIKD